MVQGEGKTNVVSTFIPKERVLVVDWIRHPMLITSWYRAQRKHHSSVAVYRPLPGNGHCVFHGRCLAMGLLATIL
jgi:hypothetical protein